MFVWDTLLLFFQIIINFNRWLGIILDMIGCIIIVVASVFAIIYRSNSDDFSGASAGLSISYCLNVSFVLNWNNRLSLNLRLFLHVSMLFLVCSFMYEIQKNLVLKKRYLTTYLLNDQKIIFATKMAFILKSNKRHSGTRFTCICMKKVCPFKY